MLRKVDRISNVRGFISELVNTNWQFSEWALPAPSEKLLSEADSAGPSHFRGSE